MQAKKSECKTSTGTLHLLKKNRLGFSTTHVSRLQSGLGWQYSFMDSRYLNISCAIFITSLEYIITFVADRECGQQEMVFTAINMKIMDWLMRCEVSNISSMDEFRNYDE